MMSGDENLTLFVSATIAPWGRHPVPAIVDGAGIEIVLLVIGLPFRWGTSLDFLLVVAIEVPRRSTCMLAGLGFMGIGGTHAGGGGGARLAD